MDCFGEPGTYYDVWQTLTVRFYDYTNILAIILAVIVICTGIFNEFGVNINTKVVHHRTNYLTQLNT